MRLGGLREGELVFDPQLERATLDPRQHLPRPRDELRTGGDVVGDGGERQKERALLVQDLRVERSDRPARLPIQHHHAPTCETIQSLLERGFPHRVIHDLQAEAVGEALRLGLEILLGVEDHVAGARIARQRRFLAGGQDRKSTRLNSSHSQISYAVFCLKKKKTTDEVSVTDTEYDT